MTQDTALSHAEQLFAEGDTNGDGVLNCEEVIALMLKVYLAHSLGASPMAASAALACTAAQPAVFVPSNPACCFSLFLKVAFVAS